MVAVDVGGSVPFKLVSAATTNPTSVAAKAVTLHAVQCFNTNSLARYLKLYDKASAPVVGTDVPVKIITIPGNTSGAGAVINFPIGVGFQNGLALALTTGAPDADVGAVGANELVVNLDYR